MNAQPNIELRTRFGTCRGSSTQAIDECLRDVGLDEITRELLLICAERSDTGIFTRFPLAIRHTMYGEDDISDWILRYSETGTTIEEADAAAEFDAHIRW